MARIQVMPGPIVQAATTLLIGGRLHLGGRLQFGG